MARVSKQTFYAYRDLCKERWGIKIVEKSDSLLMKAVALLLFFNKRFMTDYITTIGTTIYWPGASSLSGRNFKTLFHEAQHAYDYKAFPPWFILSYLSPQSLSVLSFFALLAFTGDLMWLWSLCWLIMLAPIPSVMRSYWEMRGYSCGLASDIWLKGEISEQSKDRIKKNFTSADYYYMWPFTRSMERRIEKAERKIRADDLTEVQKTTKDFLLARGLLGRS